MKTITIDFLRTAGLSLAAATFTLCCMTACTKEDNTTSESATELPAAVKTYQVSIPATLGGDALTRAVSFDGTTSNSTFEETELVYVYNVTNDEVMGGFLQPTNISADGKSCNLTGTLTGTAISSGDNLRLFYNLTDAETQKSGNLYKHHTYFSYNNQDGTQSGVFDGAEATVTVSTYTGDVLTTTSTAEFENLQSMFRFQFVDENGTAINVKSLKIKSYFSALFIEYFPLEAGDDQNIVSDYCVNLGTATTSYIYVALRINESWSNGDVLTFIVTDNDGNEYRGKKYAPDGGFVNGKYYYNSSAIQLTKQAARITPDITWNNGSPVSPNEDNLYNIDATEITISGTSNGYNFWMNNESTIHLSGLSATYDYEENLGFIYSNSNLNLDISGTNSVSCKYHDMNIFVAGTLKLSGNGTLTVTSSTQLYYGLYASNYCEGEYDEDNDVFYPGTNSNASNLAATGYTITRSDWINNGDGTYSMTYTVAPAN